MILEGGGLQLSKTRGWSKETLGQTALKSGGSSLAVGPHPQTGMNIAWFLEQ